MPDAELSACMALPFRNRCFMFSCRSVVLTAPVQRTDIPLPQGKGSRADNISPKSLRASTRTGGEFVRNEHAAMIWTVLPDKLTNRAFLPAPVPWGSELDEYDNMDDVGYSRKAVPSRSYFVEHELDLTSEEGSEGYFVHKAKATAATPGQPRPRAASTSATEDKAAPESGYTSEEDFDGRSSHGAAAGSAPPHGGGPRQSGGGPPPPTQMPASMLASLVGSIGRGLGFGGSGAGGGPLAPLLAPPGHPADEAWDLGPTDIKLADPVIISLSDARSAGEDTVRPVLSRVESLSSSFKDFDIERLDDDTYFPLSGGNVVGGGGGLRRETSDVDQLLQSADHDVVEFSPPGTSGGLAAVDLEMFTRCSSHRSRTSSTGGDLGGWSPPPGRAASETPSSTEATLPEAITMSVFPDKGSLRYLGKPREKFIV